MKSIIVKYIASLIIAIISIFFLDMALNSFHTTIYYEPKIVYSSEPIETFEVYKPKRHYPEEMYHIKATYPGVGYDLEYIERVIMAEAGAESLECQMLVAQCILNSCEGTIWNPEDIVKEVHSYAPPYEGTVNASVKEACRRVFIEGDKITEENVMYFYTQRWGHYSEFHESNRLYKEVDGVRFFIED